DSDARRKVVDVDVGNVVETLDELLFPAHAGIDREVAQDLPAVLDERRIDVVLGRRDHRRDGRVLDGRVEAREERVRVHGPMKRVVLQGIENLDDLPAARVAEDVRVDALESEAGLELVGAQEIRGVGKVVVTREVLEGELPLAPRAEEPPGG